MQLGGHFFSYVWHASFLIQLVIILLISASLLSWTLIFSYGCTFKKTQHANKKFLSRFWSTREVSGLYQQLVAQRASSPIETLFIAGYKELASVQPQIGPAQLSRIQRAMWIALTRKLDAHQHRLSWLATIGSTAPYVGLLGTVWGIMNALQALGVSEQASIALVAPGISEALVTTALGLFVSIPAVVAYNRFSSLLNRFMDQYENFQQEFIQIVCQQTKNEPS